MDKLKFKCFSKVEVIDPDSEKDSVLQKAVASHVDIPDNSQFDLLFFKAVYLSSGGNLNYAYFDKAELVQAIDTISNKAMDVEHEDHGVIGHIYAASFADKDGTCFDTADIDKHDDVDIVIAGVVYKDRFPTYADEVAKGDWYVSMETYYSHYDVMVGNLVLDYDSAVSLGVADLIGQDVVLKKDGDLISEGAAFKFLRDLHFCGGGFVKDPANPTSLVFETSDDPTSINIASKSNDKIVIDLNKEGITPHDNADKDGDNHGDEHTTTHTNTNTNTSKEVSTEEIKKLAERLSLSLIEEAGYLKLASEVNEITVAVNTHLKELSEKWTRAYINSLPNSFFMVIEPDYKNGKTDNKSARHLPYKGKGGKVDLPHLRNALARCNQIKPVTDSISTDALRSKGCAKAKSLAKKHLKKKDSK